MPKKLHRRSAVFRKKKVTFTRVLIGLLVVVGCAGVLAGGYFTAKFSVCLLYTSAGARLKPAVIPQRHGERTAQSAV